MDDFKIRNVPENGFDTGREFSERSSNPSLSRKGTGNSWGNSSVSDSGQHFSESSPILKENSSAVSPQMYPQDYSHDSRLSNPVRTRRRHGEAETAPSVPVSPVDNSHSRLSNPMQTRRRRQQSQDSEAVSFVSSPEMNGASNPSLRRRGDCFVPESSPVSAEPLQQGSPQVNSAPENIRVTSVQNDTSPVGFVFSSKGDLSVPVDKEPEQQKPSVMNYGPPISPIFQYETQNTESLSAVGTKRVQNSSERTVFATESPKISFEADEPSKKQQNDTRLSSATLTNRKG